MAAQLHSSLTLSHLTKHSPALSLVSLLFCVGATTMEQSISGELLYLFALGKFVAKYNFSANGSFLPDAVIVIQCRHAITVHLFTVRITVPIVEAHNFKFTDHKAI